MSEITSSVNEKRKAGVRGLKRHYLKIDMTPMVDLGFLLISFFVMTTQLAEPTSMNLYMPKDGEPSDLCESCALTVLLDQDNIYYYYGQWKTALAKNEIKKTRLNGKTDLRTVIGDQQHKLDMNTRIKDGKNSMMMLIKPGKNSSYKTVVDVLDEATINMVKKYALIKMTDEEKNWMARNK